MKRYAWRSVRIGGLGGVVLCAFAALFLSGCGGGKDPGSADSPGSQISPPQSDPPTSNDPAPGGNSPGDSNPPDDSNPPVDSNPPDDSDPPAVSDPSTTLNLNNGAAIRQYTAGASVVVPLSLSGGANQAPVAVTIASSDVKVAAASPNTCFLSGTGSGSSCLVTVRAVSAGSATLSASAQGKSAATAQVSVGGTPPQQYNYGQVQFGTYPTASSLSTSDFPTTAQLGQIVTLQANLTGFDQPLNGIPIFLQTTAGSIVGNPQCNVDSAADANHTCLYQLRMPSAAPAGNKVIVTARVVGNPSSFQAWNAPTVTITTTNAPVPGTIALESTDGSAPRGMSSPMWAVLRDSSGVGDTVVTLNASGTNVTINPGVKSTAGAYQQRSCTLSSVNPVCGFGVKGETAGVAAISASASSGGYTIDPLSFTVTEPLASSRVFKFQNKSNKPVWLGITSGTSNSYQTRALINSADASGPSKTCGPSNPGAACPRGSSCQQGGANPDDKTTYFCYWDAPQPSNGYELQASSSDSTTVSISDSSYDPVSDITWSGNFFPREGCTVAANGELQCVVADCGNSTSGQACAPGTGGAPAVATLPEVTLQRYNTDYYDISIIGGANVATSFGPDRSSISSLSPIPDANGYQCGTAGAADVESTLPAADWDLASHVADPVVAGGTLPFSLAAQTSTTKSTSFFQMISSVTPREAPGCSSSNACTTPGYVCGYDAAAVNHGGDSDYQTSCGEPVAWLSANQLWAMNTGPSNKAPFHFNESYQSSSGGTLQANQLFSCTAPTASGYDTANTDPSRSCGCTNWGETSLTSVDGDALFDSKIASPTTPCSTNNTVGSQHLWTANVLPTLAWLKKACPTCYTYPFDDMSSTFQCTNHTASATGTNSVPYVITFSGHLPGR